MENGDSQAIENCQFFVKNNRLSDYFNKSSFFL
ncbi:hypothetical protein MHA_2525 [Mannheimia haemolytica PHL213]|nr:hypothetical protein MHA_2525 [Mannheimia haemolytica PHL213]